MNKTVVLIARCHEKAVMPTYAHEGDSGFDIYTIEPQVLLPHTRKLLRTGLRMEIPPGYECQIRPRSGISVKTTLTVIKGTIDSGYRGEVGIIVHNTGSERVAITAGERIAQGVICVVPEVLLVEGQEHELSESTRGTKGIGSTGTK